MKALIVVDVQNDFLEDGDLPVPDGDMVVHVINDLMDRYDCIVAAQDWHPENHKSFASQHPGKKPLDVIDLNGLEQILWPDHCVQGSIGAEYATGLQSGRFEKMFRKGTDPEIDSYSGFYDNGHRKSTGMSEYLKERGVEEVHVAGLATEYCVKYTALDALKDGFQVTVLKDATRGLNEEEVQAAFAEIEAAGGSVARSGELVGQG